MELSKKITVLGEDYIIDMPQNNRDFLKIEAKKLEYSDGNYWELLELQSQVSMQMFYLVNASAFFDVVAPAIAKNIKKSESFVSVMDLDIKNSKIMLKTYMDEIDEWFEDYKKEAFGKEDLDNAK